MAIVAYLDYLSNARIPLDVDGALKQVRLFSVSYMTYSAHQMQHMGRQVQQWGNIWEVWCFVFERLAGVYTRIIRGWNHSGDLGAFVFSRLSLAAVSAEFVTQRGADDDMRACAYDTDGADMGMHAYVGDAAVARSDGYVDEGQDWGDLIIKPSMVVSLIAANDRRDRGLVETVAPTAISGRREGVPCLRTNSLCIAGVRLFGRLLSDVRKAPWDAASTPDADLPGESDRRPRCVMGNRSKLCALLLSDGDILLFDGGVMWQGTDTWELVGVRLAYHAHRDSATSLQTLAKVDLSQTGLSVVSVDHIAKLVIVIRSVTDSMVGYVIDPNSRFRMIPVTAGVMRSIPAHRNKVMDLPSLADLSLFGDDEGSMQESAYAMDRSVDMILPQATDRSVGLSIATARDSSNNTDRSAEVPNLKRPRLVRVFEEVRQWSHAIELADVSDSVKYAISLLSMLKPQYDEQDKSGGDPANVCRELLPSGVHDMWRQVLLWRAQNGLATQDLVFLDLGSGVGGVALALSVLANESVDSRSILTVERNPYLCDTMVEWLQRVQQEAPVMRHVISDLREHLLCADFITDRRAADYVNRADVVFCNNYLFSSRRNDRSTSVNDQLRKMLSANMTKHGACLITTESLAHNRHLGNTQSCRAGDFVEQRRFRFSSEQLSWAGNGLNGCLQTLH